MPRQHGPWAFLLNRSLRIFPQYACALALGLLSIHFYPAIASHINSYLRWPTTTAEWAPQIAIFGLGDSPVRVLPATWTLGTELYFYLLIGLGTARSKRASLGLCLISLPVGLLCGLKLLPFAFYGSPIGNGFVFALGSTAYFYRNTVRIGTPVFLVASAAYLVHVYAVPALEHADLDSANLTASVLPFAVLLLYLVQHPIRHPRLVQVANVLGKMAYPMFLLHWAVSVVLSAWLFHGLASFEMDGRYDGARYFAVMLLALMVCSLFFYLLIDQPVEHFRKIVRQRAGAVPSREHLTDVRSPPPMGESAP